MVESLVAWRVFAEYGTKVPHTAGVSLSATCDEMRLSVEFVTVGFLGICRQCCCD